MKETYDIPSPVLPRMLHFQDEAIKQFSFLSDFNYGPGIVEVKRNENFLYYYCSITFLNHETSVSINYSTDLINGHKTAFPQLTERPSNDNIIFCSINDPNAYMDVELYANKIRHGVSTNYFTIDDQLDINMEITRVVKNYSDFISNSLTDVLNKKKIYSCYIDRFYDEVFKEINY
jgi:hypothetical protein